MVGPEPDEGSILSAFRAEVSAWRPTHVPNLVELTRPLAHAWQRPVMMASAVGAGALAVVLALSLVLVTAAPAHVGWAGMVRDHLLHMP